MRMGRRTRRRGARTPSMPLQIVYEHLCWGEDVNLRLPSPMICRSGRVAFPKYFGPGLYSIPTEPEARLMSVRAVVVMDNMRSWDENMSNRVLAKVEDAVERGDFSTSSSSESFSSRESGSGRNPSHDGDTYEQAKVEDALERGDFSTSSSSESCSCRESGSGRNSSHDGDVSNEQAKVEDALERGVDSELPLPSEFARVDSASSSTSFLSQSSGSESDVSYEQGDNSAQTLQLPYGGGSEIAIMTS